MGAPRTTSLVLDLLIEREGNTTPIGMIVSRTGLTREQVQSSTQRLVAKNCGVERVLNGNAWVFNGPRNTPAEPKTKKSPAVLHVVPPAVEARSGNRVFSEVGQTSTGDVVIQEADGTLYKARKI